MMPMYRYQVPPQRLGMMERRMGAQVQATVRRALEHAKPLCVAKAKERTLHLKIYDLGRVYRGWYADQPQFDTLRIRNRARHTIFVEAGRRAGAAMPPAKALVPWVRRHFPVTAAGALGLAFVIARNIARRGIRARPVVRYRQFQREVNRIARAQLGVSFVGVMRWR